MTEVLIWIAWVDIVVSRALWALRIATPVLGAALLWVVMKCHGR